MHSDLDKKRQQQYAKNASNNVGESVKETGCCDPGLGALLASIRGVALTVAFKLCSRS